MKGEAVVSNDRSSVNCVSALTLLLAVTTGITASASDWVQFRGPNGSGIAAADAQPATMWSDSQNVKVVPAVPAAIPELVKAIPAPKAVRNVRTWKSNPACGSAAPALAPRFARGRRPPCGSPSNMNSYAPAFVFVLTAALSATGLRAAQSYTVVDTGQAKCYDNRKEIAPPKPGQPFYGQDAQFRGHPASYSLSADGLTVRDNVTGLTWQRSPDRDANGILNRADKLTLTQAEALPAKLNAAKFGGFDDWRLPTIKEQYSLFDARGTDPSGPSSADTSGLRPFLDPKFFKFAYGDPSSGERVIDSQYASSTRYVGKGARGFDKLFGVNFADGRIKGYDLFMPGGGREKTFFVLCVRGNPAYGRNDFQDGGDGTIADRATGLIWSKADSGQGMNWQEALAWVQRKNAEKFLGHEDWRMPSVKELQSIVDYTRSPDTSHSPAIDPVFTCTTITNEARQADYPFYWSATTHAGFMGGGAAMYVAFGRAAGWMSPRAMAGGPPEQRGGFGRGPGPGPGFRGPPDAGPPGADAGDYHYVDVHGAGAQRSDPKAGDPALFPRGRGPQGDVIRIYNYVRLVRSGGVGKRADSTP